MSIEELAAYTWLQQAFLALFGIWYSSDVDIFKMITEGGLAYELCRPVNLYNMWFANSLADRLSKAVLRSLIIITISLLIPKPYGLRLPADVLAAVCFLITSCLSLIVTVAFALIIYITAFYTYSPTGVKMMAVSVVEFLSGSIIPIPFMPDGVRQFIELLPFASMQNVPLRVYSGNISGKEILLRAGIQLFWAVALILIGKLMTNNAIKRVVVQGG